MTYDNAHLNWVSRYYDETRFDYNVAWLDKENLAVHFGFYDENASVHKESK